MFKSINYTRIVCEKCGRETVVEPGHAFKGLNCDCNSEISLPFQQIDVYTGEKDERVELLGRFKNGDYEIRRVNGTQIYRIPKQTFDEKFTIEDPIEELRKKTVDELKQIAKDNDIPIQGNLKPESIIDKILLKKAE